MLINWQLHRGREGMGPQYPEPSNSFRESSEGSPEVGYDLTSGAVARKNGWGIRASKGV